MRILLVSVLFAGALLGQTAVDALVNMYATTPSTPGTQLTTGILGNGDIGSLGGWGITGTGASLTVGAHNPLCNLSAPISISGTTYTYPMTSQAIALDNASNFTYATVSFPSSKSIASVSSCITFGGVPSTTSLMDMLSLYGVSGAHAILQLRNGACINIESDGSGTLHSGCIVPDANNPTYWCSLKADPANSLASAACYHPYYPYSQVGSTVTVQIKNAAGWNGINASRIGNAEVGTASGTSSTFENVIYDYTNAVFPLAIGANNLPWSGILNSSRATDWSAPGVVGGIPARATICSTLGTSGQAPSFVQSVTASQINSAITACPSGQTVKLNPGTYNIGAITWGNTSSAANGVTLRGSGADQTLIVFTSNMTSPCSVNGTAVCMASPDNNFKSSPSNTANWTAGYLAGTNVITLSAVSNLRIGNPIILDQLDLGCDVGGVISSDATTTCTPTSPGISGPYSLEGNGGNFPRSGRNQTEVHTIAGCNGSTTPGTLCTGTNVAVTISPPLRYPNWSSSLTPGAWWATSPIHDVGIEDLSLDCSAVTGTCIQVKNGYNTWRKGVRTIQSQRAHIQYVYAKNNTYQDSYSFLTQNAATQSYGYDCNVSGDNLVVNNIFQAIEGPIKEQGCTGDVIAYNYSTNQYYSASAGWSQPSNSDHSAGDAFNLFEGNVGKGHEADVFHGTHHFETDFRNYYIGQPPVCYASGSSYATATYGACNNNLHSFRLESFSRGFNVVGNVLGTRALTFTYAGAQPDIYEVGFGNTEGAVTVPDDAITGNTLMRWGNWDSANNATRFQSSEVPTSLPNIQQWFQVAVPASQTLPASFSYSAQPSWWPSGKAWPPIGPDVISGNISNVGGHAYTIPSQDCFLNVMGGPANGTGPVLSFNANSCYNTSGITVPTVTTTVASSITTTTASSGGTVTSTGGDAVTAEGVCIGLTANPTVGGTCTSDGTATPFVSSLSGLTRGTTYHYRAYATNSAGNGYGSDLTFTTLSPAVGLSPSSFAFSPQTISTTSAAKSTTLTNSGTATLNISLIQITGTNAADYSISANTCGSTLGTSLTCSVSVTFTPLASGSRVATLQFTTDAPTSPDNLTMTGTGLLAPGTVKGVLTFGGSGVAYPGVK